MNSTEQEDPKATSLLDAKMAYTEGALNSHFIGILMPSKAITVEGLFREEIDLS